MLILFEVQIKLPIIRLDGLFERLEQVMDVIHGERRLTKDTHDFEDRPANLKVVLDNGNEAVGDDGHVYLYSDCIFRFSPETLDLEVLLDPFEEELHLPPIFIEQGNVLCAEVEVVRVVDEASMKPWRIIDNSSDNTGILLLILLLGEANGLVFEHVVCSIENTLAIDNLVSWFALLSDDKGCPEYMDPVESGEVKVSSVRISGSVLLIIFRSLISLCFITCLIHISLNLKNDQKNRPHDPLFNLLPVAGFGKSYGARISVILNVVIQWLLRLVILCSACSEVDGCG